MNKILKATHEGILPIGRIILDCAVLEDGTRIITKSAVFRAFGRTKRGRALNETRVPNMPAFIDANNLQPFIDKDLKGVLNLINYTNKNNKKSNGYNALILPKLCKVYLDAREDDKLKPQQIPLARASEILLLGLSNVGIIALVDEATGYEKVKDKYELQKFLDKFLSEERAKWVKTFPDEFFETIFKMKGWTWNYASSKKPQVIGHYINNFVYSRLAPTVLKELKIKNPTTEQGHRKHKHTQFISPDFGHPLLKEHLHALIALSKGAGFNWNNFQRLVNRAFPKFGDTIEIGFDDAEIVE